MKRLFIISCIALFALLPIIPTTSIHAQNTADAPYIYYYSNVLNSFVIEQADGSGARQFGQDLMDDAPVSIFGPGWSPSGQWFAWQAVLGQRPNLRYVPFALNIDGIQQPNGLDEYTSALVDWSPVEDLLIVSGYIGTPQTDTETTLVTTTVRIKLIDATTDNVVFSHDIPDYVIGSTSNGTPRGNLIQPPAIFWTQDSQHFIVRTTNLTFGVNGSIAAGGIEYVYNVFDQTGLLHQIAQNEASIMMELGSLNYGLHNGKIVYSSLVESSPLVIHNLITDQAVEIGPPNLKVFSIAFSPDGHNALILAEESNCEEDCPSGVWMWTEGQAALTLVIQNAEWSSLNIANLWSPDGNFAITLTADFVPILIEMRSGAIGPIESVPAASYWQWEDAGYLILGAEGEEGTAYRVNLETYMVEHTMTRHLARNLYEIGKFSPDGSAFAYIGEYPIIQNVETGEEITVRPDGRSFLTSYGGETYWSADGEWILIAEDGVIAGGGAPRWTGIMRRDGSMRRELGQNGSPSVFGWLPDRVDVSKLPPAQAEPLFQMPFRSLHGSAWSFVVNWSPDGTHIVSGAITIGGTVNDTSPVFDVDTGAVVDRLDPIEFGEQTVEWLQNEDGTSTPQIVDHTFKEWETGGTVVGTSPDGSRVAVYNGSTKSTLGRGSLSFFEAETGDLLYTQERSAIPTFSFTPDNSHFVVSSPYSNTQILDGETWEVMFTFNTHATAVAFSPDGQTLAIANSWDIELWNVATLLNPTD
jgi:WD40 repeat protein